MSLLVSLTGPPIASASNASRILERCAHGESLAGFPSSAYAEALRSIPTVLSEYSNCEELIRKAELAAAGGGGAGGGLGGSGGLGAGSAIAPPTPVEQATLARARTEGAAPVGVGGATVHPGVVNVGIASAFSALPDSLIALLLLLLVAALTGAGRAATRTGRRPFGTARTFHLPTRHR